MPFHIIAPIEGLCSHTFSAHEDIIAASQSSLLRCFGGSPIDGLREAQPAAHTIPGPFVEISSASDLHTQGNHPPPSAPDMFALSQTNGQFIVSGYLQLVIFVAVVLSRAGEFDPYDSLGLH